MNSFQSQSLWNRAMSFDIYICLKMNANISLNPFGTGLCLSTENDQEDSLTQYVSIPLEQGYVFRR
ncbi:Uncharacterised protein [Pasteurella multocida]|nr:Uncharacterised protein [Pasteurella multocida]